MYRSWITRLINYVVYFQASWQNKQFKVKGILKHEDDKSKRKCEISLTFQSTQLKRNRKDLQRIDTVQFLSKFIWQNSSPLLLCYLGSFSDQSTSWREKCSYCVSCTLHNHLLHYILYTKCQLLSWVVYVSWLGLEKQKKR